MNDDSLRECQRLPPGHWRRWVFRAGRGAGKNYAGSRATNAAAADPAKGQSIAIIGRSALSARDFMVEGRSGILAAAEPEDRPAWSPDQGVLTWPSGARGKVFGSDTIEQALDRDDLPEWSWVWADEPDDWPAFASLWPRIELQLRAGWQRAMLTLTPALGVTKALELAPGTVVTTSSTLGNSDNLDPAWLRRVRGLTSDPKRRSQITGQHD